MVRSGRPWGPLKGSDPARHELARYLRGLVDHSGKTVKEVGRDCGCSDTTVSKRLNGSDLPGWPFVQALVAACTPPHQVPDRVRGVRELWEQAAQSRTPVAEVPVADAHTRIVRAQAETIEAQRRLIDVTDELARARKQLYESAQVEHQASQVIVVLRIVLMRLSELITKLTRDRDSHREEVERLHTQRRLDTAEHEHGRAEVQLDQAKEDRRRASAIGEAAHAKIREIEHQLRDAGTEVPVGESQALPDVATPSPDDVLLDATVGLDRVQALLDSQERDLTTLESRTVEGSVVEHAAIGVATLDLDGRILDANRTMRDIFGYDLDELLQHNLHDLMHPESRFRDLPLHALVVSKGASGRYRTERRFRRASGETFWASLTLSLADDRTENLVAMIEDVTDLHRLQNQASHDELTGLPNRVFFQEELREAFGGDSERIGLCLLNLDRFKSVNDSLGHLAGDQVLAAIGQRLGSSISTNGVLVARVSGDEFAVLVENSHGVDELARIANRILDVIKEPTKVHMDLLTVTASIGVAERLVSRSTYSDLLRDAELALRWAKADGGARRVVYDPSREARQNQHSTRPASIPLALERDEFFVEYQPIVRLADSSVSGVEAVARWRHEELAPSHFRQFVDVTGENVPIGTWLLRTASASAARWHDRLGEMAPYVSIDVSSADLWDIHFADSIDNVLTRSGLPPHKIQLEVGESDFAQFSLGPSGTLLVLADRGVRIALDDFGTGYSNVAGLSRRPVHRVKINVSTDDQVFGALMDLAAALHFRVIAVGVETEAQADWLYGIGCHAAQGPYFGSPVSVEDIDALLR